MMKHTLVFALIVLLLPAITSRAADKAPRIVHEPVTAGIQGQPVYIRATVTDDAGPAKAVNLYCSVSSDSAPFKVKMRASGASAFIAAIPDNLVRNSAAVSYYIEALDSLEQATETPWYTIRFRTVSGKIPRGGSPTEGKKSSWKKPLLIVGGTAAAIGVVLALSSSGGSSDSDDGGTTPTSADGLFAGTATRFYTPEGGTTTSETYPVTFNVLNDSTITSDDLHLEGGQMAVPLTSGNFIWSVSTSGENESGILSYSGSLAGDKIIGSISGTVVTSTGTNATYAGTFSANRQ
jgi:hypothetical protein